MLTMSRMGLRVMRANVRERKESSSSTALYVLVYSYVLVEWARNLQRT